MVVLETQDHEMYGAQRQCALSLNLERELLVCERRHAVTPFCRHRLLSRRGFDAFNILLSF